MALKGKGKRAIQAAVDSRKEFNHGTYSGRWVRMGEQSNGRLPYEWSRRLLSDLERFGGAFVIYSYNTPIAWHVGISRPGWTIPDVKYSVTTTNHQSAVSMAVHHPGWYDGAKW